MVQGQGCLEPLEIGRALLLGGFRQAAGSPLCPRAAVSQTQGDTHASGIPSQQGGCLWPTFACPPPSVCSRSWSDILLLSLLFLLPGGSSSSIPSLTRSCSCCSDPSWRGRPCQILPARPAGPTAPIHLHQPPVDPMARPVLLISPPVHPQSWAPVAPHSFVPCASPWGQAAAARLRGPQGLLEHLKVEGGDSNPPRIPLHPQPWGGEGAAMGRQQGLVLGSEAPNPPVWGAGTPR